MLTKEQKESIIVNLQWRIKKSEKLSERASEYWEKARKEKNPISAEVFEREAKRLETRADKLDEYLDGAQKMLEIFGYYYLAQCDEHGNFSHIEINECTYF